MVINRQIKQYSTYRKKPTYVTPFLFEKLAKVDTYMKKNIVKKIHFWSSLVIFFYQICGFLYFVGGPECQKKMFRKSICGVHT